MKSLIKTVLATSLTATLLFSPTTSYAQSNNDNVATNIAIHEKQAEYSRGNEFLKRFINATLKYPKECWKAKIEGRAIVAVVIDASGKKKDVELLESSGNFSLDEEALRVANKIPGKWIPAQRLNDNNEWVNIESKFIFPITFRLR